MASIDRDSGELIVRIAYDGVAKAGKTTNIQKLSEKLKQNVFTPGQPGDRTVFFDWMKYKGGSYEGRPIRCEIVTVPGQELLKERRNLLLQQADVIVEVVDISTTSEQDVRDKIKQIQSNPEFIVAQRPLVQFNKCDLAPMVPIPRLSKICSEFRPAIPFLKAVASRGEGVHQTFVMAVRAALERVKEMRKHDLLPKAEDMTGERLLDWLNKHEAIAKGQNATKPAKLAKPSKPVAQTKKPIDLKKVNLDVRAPAPQAANHVQGPLLPNRKMPNLRIWPKSARKEILKELDKKESHAECAADGSWYASSGEGWRLYSETGCTFDNLASGIQVFEQWERYCDPMNPLLSQPRCLVLAPSDQTKGEPDGRWTLWQVVKEQRSLRDEISLILDEDDHEAVGLYLCSIGAKLVEMEANREAIPQLPHCTLDNVGSHGGSGHFVGFLPSPADASAPTSRPLDPKELFTREFASIVAKDWGDATDLLNGLRGIRTSSTSFAERMCADLLGQLIAKKSKAG